jgi:hypothetical protein
MRRSVLGTAVAAFFVAVIGVACVPTPPTQGPEVLTVSGVARLSADARAVALTGTLVCPATGTYRVEALIRQPARGLDSVARVRTPDDATCTKDVRTDWEARGSVFAGPPAFLRERPAFVEGPIFTQNGEVVARLDGGRVELL